MCGFLKKVPVLKEVCMGEWRYDSTHYEPRQQMEVSGQLHAAAALPPWKQSPVPIGEWGSEEKKKIPAPAENPIPVVHPVA
jgi:hypothetical protein